VGEFVRRLTQAGRGRRLGRRGWRWPDVVTLKGRRSTYVARKLHGDFLAIRCAASSAQQLKRFALRQPRLVHSSNVPRRDAARGTRSTDALGLSFPDHAEKEVVTDDLSCRARVVRVALRCGAVCDHCRQPSAVSTRSNRSRPWRCPGKRRADGPAAADLRAFDGGRSCRELAALISLANYAILPSARHRAAAQLQLLLDPCAARPAPARSQFLANSARGYQCAANETRRTATVPLHDLL